VLLAIHGWRRLVRPAVIPPRLVRHAHRDAPVWR